MFSAISGLKSHQVKLDVTANDIANVNTIGYKSARVTFSDSLSQLQRGGSGATPTGGGANAAQVGLGVARREPHGLTGQPDPDLGAGGERGRGDRPRLVGPFGRLGPAGDLDHQRSW